MLLLATNLIDPLGLATILIAVGCCLLAAEVFIPSGGVLGFCSAAAFLTAIWFAYSGGGMIYGVSVALVEAVGIPIVLYFSMKYLPYTPLGKHLLAPPPTADEVETDDDRQNLLGRVGVARSKMLPAGAVEIDGEIIDAVSQGRPIEPGQYVKVFEVRGNRVVVGLAPTGARPGHIDPSEMLARPITELGLDDSLDIGPQDPSLGQDDQTDEPEEDRQA